MGRPPRVDVGGHVYHVLNRAVGRQPIFKNDNEFSAFEVVLAEAVARAAGSVQLLAYCVMNNHWHLVVRTRADGALSPFMKWLTLTHTQRYQVAHSQVGYGPVYQGRFKSMLVQTGEHLLTVCRYVERNPARAALVERAEDWRYSSLWHWRNPGPAGVDANADAANKTDGELSVPALSPWPTGGLGTPAADGSGRPRQWLRTVNAPQNKAELDALRLAVQKGRPFGNDRWATGLINRYDLISTTRSQGRPPRDAG